MFRASAKGVFVTEPLSSRSVRKKELFAVGDIKLPPSCDSNARNGVKLSNPPMLARNLSAGVPASVIFVLDFNTDPTMLSKLGGGEKGGDADGVFGVSCFGSKPEQSPGASLLSVFVGLGIDEWI